MVERFTLPSGLTMAYEQFGEGPLLIQLHGLGAGSRPGEGVWNFKYTTPHLAKSFTVVNVDMLGYGASDPAPEGGHIFELADSVADFIRAFADGGAAFVHGSSFGGSTSAALAARHPDVVEQLVMSVCLPRHDKAALARRALWLAIMEINRPDLHVMISSQSGFAREFFERPDADKILGEYLDVVKVGYPKKDALKSLRDIDLMDYVDAITARTLCIGGAEDHQTPYKTGSSGAGLQDFCEALTDGTFVVIEGAGHYIHFEKPAETARVITEFLHD